MRRRLAFAALAALVLALPAIASQTKQMDKPEPFWARGTITAWNETAKSFVVKSEAGEDVSLTWNADTKVKGIPKVGEPVRVKYKKDKDGKIWVAKIFVGKEEIEKSDRKN